MPPVSKMKTKIKISVSMFFFGVYGVPPLLRSKLLTPSRLRATSYCPSFNHLYPNRTKRRCHSPTACPHHFSRNKCGHRAHQHCRAVPSPCARVRTDAGVLLTCTYQTAGPIILCITVLSPDPMTSESLSHQSHLARPR